MEVQDSAASSAVATMPDMESDAFIGRWNHLVSTTNWEKGRIIAQWRDTLMAAGKSAAEYADDAWSRLVGGVTPQHVGRLRRVFVRFGETSASYEGLYWSHFQAALDWDDAEMWLEGALQSGWTVNQMRLRRWETLGAVASQKPADELAAIETDEDVDDTYDRPLADAMPMSVAEVRPAGGIDDLADPAAYDEADDFSSAEGDEPPRGVATADIGPAPFADLPSLPDDLAQAFEAFKLAIVQHRITAWKHVRRDDVLKALDALRTLVVAPATV